MPRDKERDAKNILAAMQEALNQLGPSQQRNHDESMGNYTGDTSSSRKTAGRAIDRNRAKYIARTARSGIGPNPPPSTVKKSGVPESLKKTKEGKAKRRGR